MIITQYPLWNLLAEAQENKIVCKLKNEIRLSSKNRSDMALHILLAVVEYLLNIAHLHPIDLYGNIF